MNSTFANGRIQIGESHQSGRVVIRSDRVSGSQSGHQSVRATEGLPAYIAVGASVPVTTTRTDSSGNKERTTEYRAADQGFYVTVRVIDDRVTLSIRQTDDRHRGNVSHSYTRHLTTSVTGALGQWITVGSTSTNSQKTNKGLVARSSDVNTGSGTIELLVEKL